MTEAPASPMRRYEALDSLRGICACGVVLFHFNATGYLTQMALARGGELFVDFFFVLSGFVISASYGDRLRGGYSLGRFMGLRLGRVYPLHFAVLLVFVALELVSVVVPALSSRPPFTGSRSLGGLFDNVFLLEATGLSGGPSWNTPSWSISVEMWTYLIAGLVMRYAGRWMWPLLSLLMAGSLLWLALGDKALVDSSSLGIQRCLLGFGSGMIGYALFRRFFAGAASPLAGRAVATLAEAAVVLAAVLEICFAGVGALTFLAPPLFMAVVLVFAGERGAISAWLLRPSMRLLGTLSYAIYMVHLFVLGRLLDVLRVVSGRMGHQIVQLDAQGLKMLVAPWYVADFWTIVLLALVVGLAWFAYHYIEVPAREYSRRLINRR